MSTIQSQIRARAVSLLGPATGATILTSPRRDIPKAMLPAVVVCSHSDKPENEEDDHAEQHPRIYTLEVAPIVAAREEEDATDALAILIRQSILSANNYMSWAALGVRRITWALQEWNGTEEGDGPVSATSLHFNCFYLWSPE
jgi:hypothetical protein